MRKTTNVNFAFTARRIELALTVLTAAIDSMATKKLVAKDPREVAFYEKQTPDVQAVVDLFTQALKAVGKNGGARKVRLTEQQFLMLTGAIGHRNLHEVSAVYAMPPGLEQETRKAALEEWQSFLDALKAKDPRQYDTSQDAEEEEDEDEDESEPDE